MDGKPPSSKTNLDFGTRFLSTYGAVVRFFKGCWRIWASDWSVCPIRTTLHIRCYSLFNNIQT